MGRQRLNFFGPDRTKSPCQTLVKMRLDFHVVKLTSMTSVLNMQLVMKKKNQMRMKTNLPLTLRFCLVSRGRSPRPRAPCSPWCLPMITWAADRRDWARTPPTKHSCLYHPHRSLCHLGSEKEI